MGGGHMGGGHMGGGHMGGGHMGAAGPPAYGGPPRPAYAQPPSASITLPVPEEFPQLAELPPSELEELAVDDVACLEYFDKLDFVKVSKSRREALVRENKELLTENMDLQRDVEKEHQELLELRQQYQQLHKDATEKLQLQQQI